jgi:hypothetical protein
MISLVFVFHWYYLLLAIVAILLLIFVWRVVKDNYVLFKKLSNSGNNLSKGILQTLLLWSPMLIPIVFCIYTEKKVEDYVENIVYENDFIVQLDSTERNFVKDIDISSVIYKDKLNDKIDDKLDSISKITQKSKDFPKQVGDVIRNSFTPAKPHSTKVPRNKTFSLRRHAKRGAAKLYNRLSQNVTKKSNETIKNSINSIANSIENKLDEILKKAGEITDESITKAKKVIKPTLEKARIKSLGIILNSYYTLLSVKLVLDILLILAIIKSFLYILARVIFKKNSGSIFSLDFDETDNNGKLKKYDRNYNIPGQSQETFYVKRSVALNGPHPRISFPQFFKCFIARVFTGNLGLDKIDMSEQQQMATFSQEGGREFVEYKLKKGEKCVFMFKSFVGMSSTIKLRTEYSFQLPAFLFERIRFRVAEGPGTLILKTNGGCTISPENGSKKSVALSRIIAFQKKSKFAVASNLQVMDVFFSNFHLEKQNSSNIIIDGVNDKSKRMGVIRFFLRFFIPF